MVKAIIFIDINLMPIKLVVGAQHWFNGRLCVCSSS